MMEYKCLFVLVLCYHCVRICVGRVSAKQIHAFRFTDTEIVFCRLCFVFCLCL